MPIHLPITSNFRIWARVSLSLKFEAIARSIAMLTGDTTKLPRRSQDIKYKMQKKKRLNNFLTKIMCLFRKKQSGFESRGFGTGLME